MRVWFLNLGPGSTTTNREADADIEAILHSRPALALGVESVDKGPLPPAPKGYVKIRDTSNPGRANIFAYVHDPDGEVKEKWTDCTTEFPRAEHPHLGMHPARSILQFPFQGQQIVVAHKPPLWKGAGKARWEHDQKVARIMKPDKAPDRGRLLFWDCNGMEGAQALARRVDGWLVGEHIDNAVVRKVNIVEHGYREGVGGHHFATDHPWGAFFLRWKWL
jgi:hypothetical protein